MLTVRVIEKSGINSVREVNNVRFVPSDVCPGGHLLVNHDSLPNGEWEYHEGTAYIMNSAGSTVAHYVLS